MTWLIYIWLSGYLVMLFSLVKPSSRYSKTMKASVVGAGFCLLWPVIIFIYPGSFWEGLKIGWRRARHGEE